MLGFLIGENPRDDLLRRGVTSLAYTDFDRFSNFAWPKRYYCRYADENGIAALGPRMIAIPCCANTFFFFRGKRHRHLSAFGL